jgi:sigma-E factor negative regulatory protein RseA
MNEKLSVWMDGELEDEQARPLLPQLKRDAALRADWDCYHVIGDALRGVHGPELCARVCARLESEPTVLAPRRPGGAARLRRRVLSAAASVAAVAFVGWRALAGWEQAPAQLAAVPAPAAESAAVAVAADGRANNYILAHQRYSPSSAMQGVAPYVRTVAEQRGAARR